MAFPHKVITHGFAIRSARWTSSEAVRYIFINLKPEVQVRVVFLLWTWCAERNSIREGNGARATSILERSGEVYPAETMQVLTARTEMVQTCIPKGQL
jgi:hypothetical protein